METSRLFVGGLNYRTSEYFLRKTFEKYGQITSVRIIEDRETGKSKGFGFVTFDNSQSAEIALRELNGTEMDRRIIGVKIAIEKEECEDEFKNGHI